MFVKIDKFIFSHLILMEKVFSYYTDPQNIKLVWLQESSISFISIFIDLVDFDIWQSFVHTANQSTLSDWMMTGTFRHLARIYKDGSQLLEHT